jgi:hypothetical protein
VPVDIAKLAANISEFSRTGVTALLQAQLQETCDLIQTLSNEPIEPQVLGHICTYFQFNELQFKVWRFYILMHLRNQASNLRLNIRDAAFAAALFTMRVTRHQPGETLLCAI